MAHASCVVRVLAQAEPVLDRATVLDSDTKKRAQRWAEDDVDHASRDELLALIARDDAEEVKDRMAGPLAFGTAGLRGILGAGSNRMNRAVVARTTAGLAKHLVDRFPDAKDRGVVVGYDGRRMSHTFALETASVLAGAGLVAHLFPTLCTTPQTAFATCDLNAVAGVMITASHNPPEYNGYKVYWSNGAQIIPPHDALIAAAIDQAGPARNLPRMEVSAALDAGRVRYVADDVTTRYLDAVAGLSIHKEGRAGMRIVYTAMHGVGYATARAALRRAGFDDVIPVTAQVEPDGDFPTVRFPNPEEPGAMDLAFASARENDADLILANDPDADRLAVALPNRARDGFVQLTGNQVGVLLAHYMLAKHPVPPADRLVVTTIVSSPMLGVIAKALGARYAETLTGFKWIANRALELERQTGSTFVAGYEEALGYTVGTVVRDKDGVGAAAVFAELAAVLRADGKTVLDQLEELYRTYGLFVSRQVSQWYRGIDGVEQIASIMQGLRQSPPTSVGAFEVIAIRDYKLQVRTELGGAVTPLELPSSNVLAFDLLGGSRIIARPSGTEPKIKFYFDHCEQVSPSESVVVAEQRANRRMGELAEAFVKLASR
jgi:phosphomannomutase